MTYASQSVLNLLCGPLLRTPQGWVVLAGLGVYATLALLFGLGLLEPPLGKDLGSVLVICLFWPLLTFLFYVKNSSPGFEPSWIRAASIAVWAMGPVVYVLVYG